MSSIYDITRTRVGNWDITWGSYFVGGVDKVMPKMQLKTKPIKVGSVGDVVLGQRVIELAGSIDAELRERDLVALRALMPWYNSGGSPHTLPIVPAAIHKDLYDYAANLRLHPTDAADATQDINLAFAVPMLTPMSRDGVKDDFELASWIFFPDRAQLPTLYYGYIGA